MPRTLSVVLLAVVLFAAPGTAAERFLLWEDLEEMSPPVWPAGWTVSDANGDLTTWELRRYGGLDISPQCVRYSSHPTNPADDWFFTGPVTLDAAISYTLNFHYKVSSAAHPHKLAVWIGVLPTPAGMTTMLFNEPSITNTVLVQAAVGFLPPALATYYVGFHCYSDPGQRRLFVDDVMLSQPSTDLQALLVFERAISNPGVTPTFAVGESMAIVASVTNISGGTLRMNDRMAVGPWTSRLPEFSLIVVRPTGDTAEFILMFNKLGKPVAGDFRNYTAGELIPKTYDLQTAFYLDAPGTYAVSAYYRNYHKDPSGLDAWLGKVESPAVTFVVQ